MKQVAWRFILGVWAISMFFYCDEVDLKKEEVGEVRGFWQLHFYDYDNVFLFISDTSLVFYNFNASKNCVVPDAYNVVYQEDGFFTVEQDSGEVRVTYAISRNGDRIHVRNIEIPQNQLTENDKYWPSEYSHEEFKTAFKECFPANLLGSWKKDAPKEEEYLEISEQEFRVARFNSSGGCYHLKYYTVTEVDGNNISVQAMERNGEVQEIEYNIERFDSTITMIKKINGLTDTLRYLSSEILLEQLNPACTTNLETVPFAGTGY